jgi:hypothetical protein
MPIIRRLRARLLRVAGTFSAGRRDRDFADELQSHLQLRPLTALHAE